MALSPSPNSSSNRILSPPELENLNLQKKTNMIVVKSEEILDSAQSCSSSPPPRKRNKSPGVRVVGGRIYDSENGKTCHQCRQKTMDFVVACKNPREDKPCTMKYCHKCLLNRYGAKAEEANSLDDWKCPKCRGICNCSHCMKKRGYQPIGSLLYTAKANGFRSVLEMMSVNGPETITASLKKVSPSSKENHCDVEDNSISQMKYLTLPSDGMKIEEHKGIKLEYGNIDDNVFEASKDEDTQSSERTTDAYFGSEISLNATENEENKTSERDNGDQREPTIRKKKWKKLARAKHNSNVQGIEEDGAQSEMTPINVAL